MRRLSDIVCNQNPLTLPASASVRTACEQMAQRRAGSVLVTNDEGRLVGIFTGRDVVARVVAVGRNAQKTPLGEVMTPDPIRMTPQQTAIDALRLMWDGGFRHVPLVDGVKLVGVVSRGDFSGDEQERLDEERHLWEHLR